MAEKLLVAHHLWRLGGETRLDTDAAKAACSLGLRVAAAAVSRPDPRVLEETRGCVERFYTLLGIRLDAAAMYQRLLLHRAVAKAAKQWRPGTLWIDSPLYRPLLRQNRGYRIVEYIHYPLELLLSHEAWERLPPREAWELRTYFSKYRRKAWRLYMGPFRVLARRLLRGDPYEATDLVLTNSRYMAGIVAALWGREPTVLHPPVDISVFAPHARRPREERKRAVIMLGRVSPEKRHATVVDAVAASETRPELWIVGATAASAKNYLEEIKRRARSRGVKLRLYTNVPRREMAKLAGEAMLYVHATIGEHYGITVVEAMAAGLPVVVHRSGGPYHDIIEEDRYGLSFETPEELAEAIDRLMADTRLWERLHKTSIARAGRFTMESFMRKLGKALENL